MLNIFNKNIKINQQVKCKKYLVLLKIGDENQRKNQEYKSQESFISQSGLLSIFQLPW